jgi:His/Glu/Gln/Arg/opine family amino acid ABC transporter permease subunit
VNFDVVIDNLPFLLDGVVITVAISVVSLVGGLVFGLLGAVARLSNRRVAVWLTTIYVDVFRSIPVIVQIIWVFYALPLLLDRTISPFIGAALALSLYSGAFFTEIFRAGILALPSGQREAGLAIGMTQATLYRRILLPQAVRTMLPVIGSQFVLLIKESALASVIGAGELLQQSDSLANVTLEPLPVYTAALIGYILLTYPVTVVTNVLHRRALEGSSRPQRLQAVLGRWGARSA